MNSSKQARHKDDDELIARAAWLHFVGGLTQGEVADRLFISTTRAHRAIAKAQASGLVQISVSATSTTCLEIESKLADAYRLSMCRVAMSLPERGSVPLKSLGAAGGEWLTQVINSNAHDVIGISHGRTIAATVEQLGPIVQADVTFVSLLGGLTQSLAANPYDVIHRLTQKTGAEAYLTPAPLFTNSLEDRQVMLAQSMLTEAFARMRDASLAIVGIGDLSNSIGVTQTDLAKLKKTGAVAEILGQFIDASGAKISTPMDGRTMAFDLDDLAGREVVAIAGGAKKLGPIKAALSGGMLSGLIIDEDTARALVNGLNDQGSPGA